MPTIVEFVEGRAYLALEISPAQRVLLKAIYGLALEGDEELDLFRRCTGREEYSPHSYGEVTIVAGARSGKDSRIAVPIALYEAIYGGHAIAKGEVGVIPLFAQDAEATQTAFDYARGYLVASARLSPFLLLDSAKKLKMRSAKGHPMEIHCLPCTGRAVRGKSVPAAIMDEVAFFRTDSGKALDKQIQEAVRRGMVAFRAKGRPRLVKISTPALGGRVGVMFADYDRYFGVEQPDVLVWHAPTTLMNPAVTEADLAEDRRKNPLSARREYDAEFIASAEGAFLELLRVEACTRPSTAALAPDSQWRYVAFADPSGGGADEFALAIGHTEDGVRVRIDYVAGRVREPGEKLELTQVVADYAEVIKRYRCGTVKGDKFAGDWVAQEFRKHGIAYDPADKHKSQLYREAKPFFNEDRVELPADPILTGQLGGLEERVKPGGRVPMVDHAPGGHDDRANAVCGVIAELAASMQPAVGGMAATYERAAAREAGDPESAALHEELNQFGPDGVPRRGAMGFGRLTGVRMFR
ncbi:MAG TPA: hypothetical protein VKA83_09085 [Methylomirabilota bacterium]|nr:hypothetical protein [Methylomirabilota bacterium]